MTALFTDSGTAADENPLATNYTTWPGTGPLKRASNKFAAATSGQDNGAYVDSITTPNDQYCQAEVATVGDGDGGPAVRLSTSTNSGMFLTNYNGANIYAFSYVSGSANQEANPTGVYAAADDIYLGVQGTTYTIKENGSTLTTFSDATFSAGSAGMVIYGTVEFVNLEVGDFASGQSINVGLSSETDSSLAVAKKKAKAVGLSTETDSALVVSPSLSSTVGLPTETDSALSVGKRKSKAVGLNTEADSAFSVWVSGGFGLPTTYYTAFPDTENPIDQDGMFRVGTTTAFYGTPRSTPGKCFAATFVGEIAADFDDCLAHLINHAVPVDHRVTATVFRAASYAPTDTHELALYARMEIGAEFVRGYEVLFSAGGAFQVVRWEGIAHEISNFFTGITVNGTGPGTLADGDEIALQVIGDDFEVFKNDASVATFTDATWSDGNPGMGFFVRPGDTTKESFALTSWAATPAGSMVMAGIPSETDTAFALSHIKVKSAGLASSTDSAFALSHTRQMGVGTAQETDYSLLLAGQATAYMTDRPFDPFNWWRH